MSPAEWESLCDGCGQCCLYKIEDEDTDELFNTNICCELFNAETGRCRSYADRKQHVPDCQVLTPAVVAALPWLPKTCAYRLLHEGRPLFSWHPLLSGDPDSVRRAGVSVRDRVLVAAEDAGELTDHVVEWSFGAEAAAPHSSPEST